MPPQHTHASCINRQRSCCFALFTHRMPCNLSPALDTFPCPCQSETLRRPLNTCKLLSRDKTLAVLLCFSFLSFNIHLLLSLRMASATLMAQMFGRPIFVGVLPFFIF